MTQVPKMPEPWWKDWLSPGVVIAAVAAVAMLGYMVFYRIPDLEKQLSKVSDEQAIRFQQVQQQYRDTFDKMQVQLVNVRANRLRLCMRGGPKNHDCEIKDLVATVGEMSNLQSQFLAAAEVKHLTGDVPTVASSQIQNQLFGATKFPRSAASTTERSTIASLVAWSTIARDAVWSVEDQKLKVNFSNGSAVFTPKESVSKGALNDFVASLNNVSGIVQNAVGFPEGKVAN
jgi:hypothetical protein